VWGGEVLEVWPGCTAAAGMDTDLLSLAR
jgi:hypothetical protein